MINSLIRTILAYILMNPSDIGKLFSTLMAATERIKKEIGFIAPRCGNSHTLDYLGSNVETLRHSLDAPLLMGRTG